ncbi:helix-turn-helix domain-containing protein [Paenibacillus daejeonensis]|uniref:helix-turn-helix domain-containing protein n=1 Tax=Paenibacillus daejeonensis TaxID=135193 RepID=UPI00036D0F23|nr:helix-turn-helix domain-containing protein [Paenibacillus daejeonensis]
MPRFTSLFQKFLFSYLIILMIPSIAGYVSYRTSIAVTQSMSIDNSVSQLQRSQEILERRMAEVEGFTRQLALNPDLQQLMNEKRQGEHVNVYGIANMVKQITPFSQTNDFLQHFYIYLNNYDVILTQGTVYVRPEHYYGTYHYSSLTLEQWRESILGSIHTSGMMPLQSFVNNGRETTVLTYMQSLPLDSFGDASPATVVILIDGRMISSLLAGLEDRYGGWAHISDDEGRTIGLRGISETGARELATTKMLDSTSRSQFFQDDLVITIRSEKTGWTYRAGIPREVLMANANQIKEMTWLVTGVALVLGLLAGLLLAYRNSAPINRLIGVMKEQFGKEPVRTGNAYDFLQGNISTMISSNRRLEQALQKQMPLVRDGFLRRLLAGEFHTPEEITTAAQQADTVFPSTSGYVGILRINGYTGMDSVDILNELAAARLILKQSLSVLAEQAHTIDLGSDALAFIWTAGDGSSGREPDYLRQELNEVLTELATRVYSDYKVSCTAAVGGIFHQLLDTSHAFEQARQTLDYAEPIGERHLLWYGDAPLETATYYYPLDVEQRLISTIRAGEPDEAARVLAAVIAENTEQRQLAQEMRQQLTGELKGTLLKLLDHQAFAQSEQLHELKQQIVDIPAGSALPLVQEELERVTDALCQIISSKKNHAHIQTVDRIRQVISEQYGDSELTLYRIAEQVGRPEKYISQLFKEVTGDNISDHLERVRMHHASALLSSEGCTVDDIAARVGYNSSHSFRRAFKRVMGVAPSAYRQSLQS